MGNDRKSMNSNKELNDIFEEYTKQQMKEMSAYDYFFNSKPREENPLRTCEPNKLKSP